MVLIFKFRSRNIEYHFTPEISYLPVTRYTANNRLLIGKVV